MSLKAFLNKIQRFIKAYHSTRVMITLDDDTWGRRFFKAFTRRTLRGGFLQSKRYGVALLPVPEPLEVFKAGKERQAMRTNIKRAQTLGYRCSDFDAHDHLEEIMAIHRSMGQRQGKSVASSYLDERDVVAYFRRGGMCIGVFDRDDRLCAYAHVPTSGQLMLLSRIMGSAASLADGVMYLLIWGVVGQAIAQRKDGHDLRWIMYNTMFDDTSGLGYFKGRLGFSGHVVSWRFGGLS